MKTLFLFTFFFGLFTSLAAQTIRCPKEDCGRFQRFIQAAQDAADKPDFNQAIIQYNAARVCCPSAAEAIDAQILKIFELIENQRKMAAANADRAQKAEAKTKSALDKAERLVGFFGFTQNRAWAYKNGKFAVIDRNGTQWTDFVYENPDPFQPNGYALARKGGFYVLVDTLGRTSPEYDYLFPTNHGCYKVRKEKKYTFADFKGSPLPGASWYESIDTFCNGLATVNKKDQWGFIDSKGQEEIKAKFQSVSSFQGDLAWAANDNGKWGIINKKGQYVTPQEFSNGAFLKPGISWARKPGKWGVVDKNGKFITPPQYDQIREFENGFASVTLNGKQGYINARGEEVIPPKFELITNFSEGFAIVLADSMRVFIDTTGKFPFPERFEKAFGFYEGLAAVKRTKEEKWGYIDRTGKFVIEPKFETALSFSDSLAWVTQSDKKKRLIDRKGNYLSDLVFDDFSVFSEGLAAVKMEDKWGFIDKKGNLVISAKYTNVESFDKDGLAAVETDNKWGFIDKKDNPVIPAIYSSVRFFSEDMACVEMDKKYGYINRQGSVVIPLKYPEADNFIHGVASVRTEKGWGLINKKGDWVAQPQYEHIGAFSEGLATVYHLDKSDGQQFKYGYIDTLGHQALPLKYTWAGHFSEGRAKVTMDSLSGFIDRSGNFIFQQITNKANQRGYGYDGEYRYYGRFANEFNDGLATVADSGRIGFIDQSGAWLIRPQFELANYISEGKIAVNVGGESGMLNNQGKFIKKFNYRFFEKFNNDIVIIRNQEYKTGYIHLKYDTIIEPRFNTIQNFSNGTAWVSIMNEKEYRFNWGLIDERGKYIIEPKYEAFRSVSDDLVWVRSQYYWILIDKKGKTLPVPEVENCGDFSEGLAWVERNGLRGYVDITGNLSIPFRYETYYNYEVNAGQEEYAGQFGGYLRNRSEESNSEFQQYEYMDQNDDRRFLNASILTGNFSGGLAAAYENEMWGYINKKGAFVVQPRYEWAGDFSDGLAWVRNQSKWGLIDTSGKFVLPPRYDWGLKFSNGFAQVVSTGKFGLIDKSLNEIIKPEYEAIVSFSEGLALVKKDGKWGYINTAGELVIAPQFDKASDFIHGKAVVEKFGEEFIINKKGQLIIEREETLQPSGAVPDDSRPSSGDR